jgi:HSP20 family protein
MVKGPSEAPVVEKRPPATRHGDGSPLAFMRRFFEEMDRVYEDFGVRLPSVFGRGRELFRREVGLIPAEWSPRIDDSEEQGKFLVRADLPGLAKDDIKIELTNDLLTIQGERKQSKEEHREGCLYSECSYGSFYRALPIPEGVETSKATARFQNGVLEISMPAAPHPATQARRLEIHETK